MRLGRGGRFFWEIEFCVNFAALGHYVLEEACLLIYIFSRIIKDAWSSLVAGVIYAEISK